MAGSSWASFTIAPRSGGYCRADRPVACARGGGAEARHDPRPRPLGRRGRSRHLRFGRRILLHDLRGRRNDLGRLGDGGRRHAGFDGWRWFGGWGGGRHAGFVGRRWFGGWGGLAEGGCGGVEVGDEAAALGFGAAGGGRGGLRLLAGGLLEAEVAGEAGGAGVELGDPVLERLPFLGGGFELGAQAVAVGDGGLERRADLGQLGLEPVRAGRERGLGGGAALALRLELGGQGRPRVAIGGQLVALGGARRELGERSRSAAAS